MTLEGRHQPRPLHLFVRWAPGFVRVGQRQSSRKSDNLENHFACKSRTKCRMGFYVSYDGMTWKTPQMTCKSPNPICLHIALPERVQLTAFQPRLVPTRTKNADAATPEPRLRKPAFVLPEGKHSNSDLANLRTARPRRLEKTACMNATTSVALRVMMRPPTVASKFKTKNVEIIEKSCMSH